MGYKVGYFCSKMPPLPACPDSKGKDRSTMKEQIMDVLRPLGLTERYRGYPILIEAVNQTITIGIS